MAIFEQPVSEPQPLRWTKSEYYRMGELGLFESKRVELIDGEIIEMQPIGVRHVRAVALASEAVRRAFGGGFWLSVQNPFDVGGASDPQPDIAVLPGDPRLLAAHPTTAALLIEVSDATLRYDRTTKAALYARAGIGDYWVINLVNNVLEVYRQPNPVAGVYAAVQELPTGESIAPLGAPHAVIAVADLLA